MYNPRVHMRIIYLRYARIQKVLPEGVLLWQRLFFLDEGKDYPNST